MVLTKRQALGSVSKGLSFVCYQLCYLYMFQGFVSGCVALLTLCLIKPGMVL